MALIRSWDDKAEDWHRHLGLEGDGNRRFNVNPAIWAMLGDLAGKTALDAGCGSGYLALQLAERDATVIAVDWSPAMIAVARRQARARGLDVDLRVDDCQTLETLAPSSVDLPVSNYVLQDLPDLDRALASFRRALRPDGTAVVVIGHPCFNPPAGAPARSPGPQPLPVSSLVRACGRAGKRAISIRGVLAHPQRRTRTRREVHVLERLTVRNFKRFGEAVIELGDTVVLIGPNNSGKTSVLQALALWELGLRRWMEKRGGKAAPKRRSGITLNRRDLVALPVPDANLLWRDLRLREVEVVDGRKATHNIRIDIVLEGTAARGPWRCGLEFDYANPESLYCRPLRTTEDGSGPRMRVPAEAAEVRVAYLPPMSGLAANETRLDPGAVAVRLGEGRTAEVLRNLCHQLHSASDEPDAWCSLVEEISALFGVTLDAPVYVAERGEVTMTYTEPSGVRLDLAAAGRGLQQTLLLLAWLHLNPRSVVLLDEPDAHLEILRQRQTYQLITEVAQERGCQLIAASHSEVLLAEAAGRDVVVAFAGRPHRVDGRASQVLKSLALIGYDSYYQAELTGWVLYLEGPTDLAILRAFARTLDHPAQRHLERPFVQYVEDKPQRAREHFFGLREAVPDLVGLLLLDRVKPALRAEGPLHETMWARREIESYLCTPAVVERYARREGAARAAGPLFAEAEAARAAHVMLRCVEDQVPPVALRDPGSAWWDNVKASDELLAPVFEAYFEALGLPNRMRKTSYHVLAGLVPPTEIAPEVVEQLDRISDVAGRARPRAEER